ncbi:MAG: DUF2894 domain-containing protein [Pseudomonadales bacterium]|nr:DUF2894 domain-containing protein [Pseudomonadales bacterium]
MMAIFDNNTATSCSIEELTTHFDILVESGASQFDSVRFKFIEAMYTNAISHRESVRSLLKDKIIASMVAYQADFEAAKLEAAQSITSNMQLFPDDAEKLQTLFDQARFSQLQSFSEALHIHEQEGLGLPSPLTELTEELTHLSHFDDNRDSPQIGFAFDDLLRQQEEDTLNALITETQQEDPQARPDTGNKKTKTRKSKTSNKDAPLAELKSARAMRETFGKINADKLVTQMIKNGPENPGPLNPHKLIVNALTDMRDLSPHYLNRFIASIDTLLWLEQAENKLQASKGKKADSGKKKTTKR